MCYGYGMKHFNYYLVLAVAVALLPSGVSAGAAFDIWKDAFSAFVRGTISYTDYQRTASAYDQEIRAANEVHEQKVRVASSYGNQSSHASTPYSASYQVADIIKSQQEAERLWIEQTQALFARQAAQQETQHATQEASVSAANGAAEVSRQVTTRAQQSAVQNVIQNVRVNLPR